MLSRAFPHMQTLGAVASLINVRRLGSGQMQAMRSALPSRRCRPGVPP